ncbi:PTS sugar transporter subunit IIB [Desulfovibrio legallii]|uniref:PTS system, mannose-specific IIB component n=1 Tax=Desulfovibrio legallii TaxID=571438 RepID=A0A1G7LF18_9BACT|nr:PTS sugar transporter subunit IIB [Desulfovibrio legallii]SDF47559.1 PTS system, mannose-specific IIB component [Desulfovibrio legallii]
MWFRVDNRLVHGQVIEAWLPYTGARHLVVANDELAADFLRQQIVALAVPQRVAVHFIPVRELAATLNACGDESFVLFATCQDARRACDAGIVMEVLNMGNLHYGPEKLQILPNVALSAQDREDLRVLRQHLVQFDFRSVPSETVRGPHEQLF